MATKSILKETAAGERRIFKDVIKNSNTTFYSDKPEIKRKETWYEKVNFTAREVFVSIREQICNICCKEKREKRLKLKFFHRDMTLVETYN